MFFDVIYLLLPVYIFTSYNFENISEEQFPPKPNEFDNTCLINTFFEKVVSGIKGNSAIGVVKRRLGYIIPCFIASTENTASIPPLAPNV